MFKEKDFYEADGWSLFTIAETGLLEVLSEAAAIDYDIRNCRRGAYGISGDTVEDLKSDLIALKEKLDVVINQL
jgi:hypothetical protein